MYSLAFIFDINIEVFSRVNIKMGTNLYVGIVTGLSSPGLTKWM